MTIPTLAEATPEASKADRNVWHLFRSDFAPLSDLRVHGSDVWMMNGEDSVAFAKAPEAFER
ncbi:MAG TPA: hypothetical protein VEY91_06955, partial [Candidatus Limnocylindria bacterium]|nr:hypothetical protein [Candidatus Limnocylindria bacterium]